MASKGHKISREELEQDEVAESLRDFVESVKANRIKLIIIGGAALLLILGAFAYKAYRTRVTTESSRILNRANDVFAQLSSMQDDAERKKQLELTAGNLQGLIERFPDSPAARTALYLQGNCYYLMDESAKAVASYQRYIAEAKNKEELADGHIALGYTLENQYYLNDDKPKLEEAQKHFEAALESAPPKSYLYYYALMGKARMLETAHRDAEAVALYKRIMSERPSPTAVKSDGTEDKASFTGGMAEFAKKQIDDQLALLSLYATVRTRLDRLEAAATVVNPAAPESGVKSGDSATSGTALEAPAAAAPEPAAK